MAKKKDNDLPFPELEDKKEITAFSGNITKSEISEKAGLAIATVNNGHIDPIDMYLKTRALKEVCDEVLDGIKSKVVDKLQNMHKEERKFRGVDMQVTEGSIKYSFDHSEKWNELKDAAKSAAKAVKDYEDLMVNAINNEIYGADGVLIEGARISGGSDPVLKVVIPK